MEKEYCFGLNGVKYETEEESLKDYNSKASHEKEELLIEALLRTTDAKELLNRLRVAFPSEQVVKRLEEIAEDDEIIWQW